MGDTTIGSLSSNNGTDWKSLAELFGKDKKDLKEMFIYTYIHREAHFLLQGLKI